MNAATSTRRTLLGVLAIVPVLAASAPMAPPAPTDGWDSLHGWWLAMRAAALAAEARYLALAHGTVACDRAGRVCDEAQAKLDAAETLLLNTPSPHNRALLWKIEYALQFDDDGDSTPAWSGEHIAPVLRDARRMLG